MKAIYLDCISGISGNMFLGACLQAGVPATYLVQELNKLSLSDKYEVKIDNVDKNGIAAVYVDVNILDHHDHEHHHDNEHHHEHGHHHRNMSDIRQIISQSTLSENVKNTALSIFEKLAVAEGKVHNRPAEEVNFHEVGAVDSIVDIVGCAICIEYLEIEKVFVSKINVGSGFVKCAHGLMPVPAPATAELLKGYITYHNSVEKELTTPTGAAIIATLAQYSDNQPTEFSIEKIAYGAGTYDLVIPNVLRIYLGEYNGRKDRQLMILEANIDDMNPQIYGYLYDKLLDHGSLDVWTTPIFMKKNRPAYMLSVLIDEAHEAICTKIIFEETTTIGLRVINVDRRIEAVRRMSRVETAYGEVRCKVSAYDGKIVSITPEYEDRRKLAESKKVPIKAVWQDALAKQNDRLG
ncbi:MAG: nickel pincer cofactor biosynthesis protein LarC [Selenomonadaceae bacterium]|nr:nickel pincer cofactor biosynthesis protein LarC [Selenomonadaceae bacterium]